MSDHRTQPHCHRGEPTQVRYGRMAIAGSSATVVLVAALGATGILPSVASGASGSPPQKHQPSAARSHASPSVTPSPAVTPSTSPSPSSTPTGPPAVPADSGSGRRVVFSQAQQRVWLVRDDGTVANTYLVSGSVTDNLRPGSYHVYSRSRHAVGVEDSGTMNYFVRFAEGPTGAAIGFHDIPIDDGQAVQTRAQLGTPESHGCIRQAHVDAVKMWHYAPTGTAVDVVA